VRISNARSETCLAELQCFMRIPRRRTANLLILTLIVLTALRLPEFLEAQQSEDATAVSAAPDPLTTTSSPQLQAEEIIRMLGDLRQELKASRQEVNDLKKEVNELRDELEASTRSSSGVDALKTAVDELHDDQQVLQSQVKTLDQTKVGTESRYPLRVTGMILLNSFVVDGAVDNPILPVIALPRNTEYVHHSLGATLQQTQLGLNASGPRLWSARTSADLTVDFFNPTYYTTTSQPTTAYLRFRTANINLDWQNTRISGGLQTPLITPLSPTSFATVAEPALSWAGNLWTWLPQVSIERRKAIGDSAHALVAFGLLDPEAGDITGEQAYGILRQNLQPGYEGRVAYEWGTDQRPFEIGASGYYTRQLYYGSTPATNQALDFWAGTADWRVPLPRIAELSGEFYRGRGLGDLGGGAFKNVVKEYGAEYVSGLDDIGGWTQLKFRFTPTLEANAFFGEDNANAREVRDQVPVAIASPYSYLIRNQSTAVNLIFRPKTYLVFAGEYRYLESWYAYTSAKNAQTLGLTMGYLF
jgi:hypothetical protein